MFHILGDLTPGSRCKMSDLSSPSSKLTLKDAICQTTDAVLVCSSVVHDLFYEAAEMAEKEKPKKAKSLWQKVSSLFCKGHGIKHMKPRQLSCNLM